MLGALCVVAGYQARPAYSIEVGGPLDAPYLRGFSTREATPGEGSVPFRWTVGSARIVLPNIGAQDLVVSLTLNGVRPAGVPTTTVRIGAGGMHLLEVVPGPAFQDYTFPVSRDLVRDGTLVLSLDADTFTPEGDPNPRPLGVVVGAVQASPGPAPDLFISPPLAVLLPVAATGALVGLVLLLLGTGMGLAAAGSVVPGLLAGYLLVTDRLWLTGGGWPQTWVSSTAWAAAITGLSALALWLLRGLVPLRAEARYWRLLLALIFGAALVRLAGQLHPQIFIIDLNFHRNRFDIVRSGDLLFTIRSDEWGGRETFYLPTAYILMTPIYALLNDMLMTIRLFTVAVGTWGLVPLFAIAAKAWNARAGFVAALLYVILPISILPFSWGITTNLAGEFALLCALATAFLAYERFGAKSAAFWLLLLFMMLALLSHPGVVQLTGVAFALLTLLWVIAVRGRWPRAAGWWVAATLLFASAASYLLYYRHFLADMLGTFGSLTQIRGGEAKPGIGLLIGGSVSDRSLGLMARYAESWSDWFWGGLRGFWAEAQAYYRVWPVGAAALGFVTAGRVWRSGAGALLNRAALAWALAALLFLLVGWVLNLYVRYSLFSLPVIALGAGVLLERIWGVGRWGRVLVGLVLVFFTVQMLVLWHYRITYAFK
jgi:hypothetical protein